MRMLRRLGLPLSLGVLLSVVGCGGGGGGGASSDSRLAGIALSAGTLVPTFEPGVSDYTVEVDCAVGSVAVTPVAEAGFTTITVNGTAVGSGVPSAAIPLAVTPASNLIEILVTAPDGGSTSRYRITYTRLSSSELASLLPSAGTLAPALAPGQTAYQVIVDFTVTTIAMTSSPLDPGATLEVNGGTIAAGVASVPMPLAVNPATNTVEVKVVASDGSVTTVYAITVVRLPDLRLAGLAFSRGELSPAFDAGMTAYTLDVGTLVPSVTLKPTVSDPAATLRVSGTPVVSGATTAPLVLTLTPGGNPIDVEVTGSDGVTVAHTTISAMRRLTPREDTNVTSSPPIGANAVAIDGDTMVVGSFADASGATGVNGNEADTSAAYAGAAYVFVRQNGSWSRQAYLKASNTGAGDYFGYAVAISGDTIVVGAPNERSNATGVNGNESNNSLPEAGAAYVFIRVNGSWSQEAYLKASNTGSANANAGHGDGFGGAVSISGDTSVVGAYGESSGATGVNGNQANTSAGYSGAAYVFVRASGAWTQLAYLKASNTRFGDEFGTSVAVSGDTVVVGAIYESSSAGGVNPAPSGYGTQSGAAYVFVRSGTTWSQEAHVKASSPALDGFGMSVAIDGNTIVVGAATQSSSATDVGGSESNAGAPSSGAAFVFTRQGSTWSQQAFLKASNTGADDNFGQAVAISGDAIVVGAMNESSNATGVGGNGANDSAPSAGAAYVFVRSGSTWSPRAYVKASTTNAGDGLGWSVAASIDTIVVAAPGAGSTYVFR